ncbi:hypothetical protein EVJ29_13070 [Exiguobacterium sp. SH4S7]|uniref:hypothetical protein n=1 Tax=Exiguobacterium sp. SH4S7 TaxID=2510958 RepID=UPI00103CE569|nr:hypothetical protein [Exiguobacterium sp. SH4S7]TCI33815.1 hypothetical protein EVJ29_13070 [Exiguobacterium sp. SH4S7]
MEKLTLKLKVEMIDFNVVDSPPINYEITSYQLWSDGTNQLIENLYDLILKEKGDWIGLKSVRTPDSQEVDFLLMFTKSELNEEDNRLLKSIVQVCESYIAESLEPKTEVDEHLLNTTYIDSMGDGMIVSAQMNGGTGLSEFLEKKLSDQGIEYTILRRQQERVEAGASGGMEHVLIHIAQWVLTSAAWDILKKSLNLEDISWLSFFRESRYEEKQFKRIRSSVAERTRINEIDLILKDKIEDEKEVTIVFEVRGTVGGDISLICDHYGNIKDLSNTATS